MTRNLNEKTNLKAGENFCNTCLDTCRKTVKNTNPKNKAAVWNQCSNSCVDRYNFFNQDCASKGYDAGVCDAFRCTADPKL